MKNITFSLFVVASIIVPFCTPTWAAEHGGSMEDQLACTPDVYKLCSQFIPDEDSIVSCLQKNIKQLSPACHKVFTAPPSPKTDSDDD